MVCNWKGIFPFTSLLAYKHIQAVRKDEICSFMDDVQTAVNISSLLVDLQCNKIGS